MLIPQADLENDSEMWNMYLDEVKEEDSRIIRVWKDNATSIVTFVSHNLLGPVFISVTDSKTGLLSAIIGIFIIEFYKTLSSDSRDQTVALIRQISQQLPNSPISTNPNTASQPSSHRAAMVWVNALWLISLVLSLTSALIATLLLQWAHIYTETPKSLDAPGKRAHVRSLLLDGTKHYKIPLIVEILPTLLHLSVFLFLGGLVIAFHTIDKTVAVAVDVAVGVSGLTYLALSIVPCLDVQCPYRTPISKILWYPCHALLSLAALCLYNCIRGLHKLLNQTVLPGGQDVLLRWLQSRGFSVSNHWRFLMDGLQESILIRAAATQKDGDRRRVVWLFNQLALGDKDKFLKFAASIPRNKIPHFISTTEFFSFKFRESLIVLLRSCIASRYTAEPNVDVYERSLLGCLHTIRHVVKANEATTPDLYLTRASLALANTSLMQLLWDDMDDSIRMTSRSICALVAKQVVRKQPLNEVDRSWLEEVTGESPNSILEAEANVTVLGHMNFISFVNGALPDQETYRDLSAEDATSFNETLAILLDVTANRHDYFTNPGWETRLSEEVERMQEHDPEGASEVFDKLRLVFPSLPPVTFVHPIDPPPRAATPPGLRGTPPSPSEATPPDLRGTPPSPSEATPSRAATPPGLRGTLPSPSEATPPGLRGTPPSPSEATPSRAATPPGVYYPRGTPPSLRAATPPVLYYPHGTPPFPRAATPPGVYYLRGTPPSPSAGTPPRAITPPRAATSPRAVTPPGVYYLRGTPPSSSAATPPRVVYLPGAIPPSHGAHRRRATM